MAKINLMRTKRGEMVTTDGGARGRFVGTTASGTDWILYADDEAADPGAWARICAAFDART